MKTAFEYQLEILKWELDHIESGIRKLDDITREIKNWAIIVWGVSLGTVIATDSLKPYIGLTAIFPLLFWFVDARFRRIQRSFIYRLNQISDFLNSDRLDQSFKQQTLVEFILLDPRAAKSKGPDYESFVSMRRILRWGSVSLIYLGLALLSLAIHLIVR